MFRGNRYIVSTEDVTITPSLINEEYEAFELDLLEKVLRPGMTVIDVGANVGIYSIISAKNVQPEGRVFAFEPVPANLAFLERNLQLNGVRNVEVLPMAVGSEPGLTRIRLSATDMGTHSVAAGKDSSDLRHYVEVPITTIDDFVARRSVRPDVIKIDIEGYEPFAIQGARMTLQQRPILFIEFSAPQIEQYGSNPMAIARYLLRTYDFAYILNERWHKLVPIHRPEGVSGLWNGNLLLTPHEFNAK